MDSQWVKTAAQKRWVQVVIAAVGLLTLVILVIPFLVNAESFRPTIEAQLSSALGRKVSVGHLSSSLLSGGLVAENISIADDPAYSSEPFIQAKKLTIGVELMPLLFSHRLEITDLALDSPAIQLIQTQGGKWNFSSFGSASPAPASNQPAAIPNLTIGELKIKDGSATVSSVPATAKPFVYSGINLAVQQLSFAKSFPFQLSANLPGDGTFQLTGNAGPLAQNDAAATPFHAGLQVKHFDPVAAGVVDPKQGISMVLDIDAQLSSDGTTISNTGKIEAQHLHLAKTGAPANKPVDINYAISDNLGTQSGQVSDVSVNAGSVAAHVKGAFQSTAQVVALDLHLSAPNLPIDQLEQLLPAVGVTLPSGSSLKGGTLTANLAITGPATEPVIAGPVEMDNTKLAGFDIGSRISGVNPFGGSGGGTAIKTLRTQLNNTSKSTQLSNIYADLPQVGTASGGGSVSESGNLDFKLIAKFSPATGVGAVAGKVVNAAGSLLSKTMNSSADKGVPLTITGTTSNPNIKADYGAMFKPQSSGGGQQLNPSGALKGLFGKK
jgi:AsmA protein